ncbi:SRPBCC family protein [Fredinandcohnia sp. QZ13]|uniref:SRPBCC family protein n=1 Tax=Fredinandcohnia sp. QZ13 TaxID=3073144 RepID=UPI00285356DF|nr:SRPBCC family protein [Fredinandcohnia sp. QZ13]MDR4889742.1 SRPBCC family protein [Fredinandcohnia sp. QZ13]
MKQSIVIESPISDVFECIATANLREKWFPNVTSIRYSNPNEESKTGASFQLTAEEGKEHVVLQGRNKEISHPSLFAFELESQTYIMTFSYHLHQQGEHTLVEQEFETKYHRPVMNAIDKLFKSSAKQTGEFVLNSLENFSVQNRSN